MEHSDTNRSESSRNIGEFDVLEEVFQIDDVWLTAWEHTNAGEDGMVLVDAEQYAAFLKWQARNHEEESVNAPLDPNGKSLDIPEKKDTGRRNWLEKPADNVLSAQHDVKDQPSPPYDVSSSGDEAQAWCEEFDRKMDRMGIREDLRQTLKLLEMSQLMDNDIRLFELVKKKDDEEGQESSKKPTN